MPNQGFASIDWDRIGTFGLVRGDNKRWKLNRGAPETTRKGRLKKQGNAVMLTFPEVPGVCHSIRKPIIAEKARLSEEQKHLTLKVLRLAREKNLSPKEAAELLREAQEKLTPRIILENR